MAVKSHWELLRKLISGDAVQERSRKGRHEKRNVIRCRKWRICLAFGTTFVFEARKGVYLDSNRALRQKIITIWFYSPSFNERLNCIGFQWILSHYPTNSINFRTQLVFVLISDISHTMMSYKWTQKYFSYFACFSRWAFSFFLRDYSRNSSVTKL